MPNPIPKVAFISGHMDLTPLEFAQHYIPTLNHALALNHSFVIGDAPGVDAFALAHLLAQPTISPQRITIHVSRPAQRARFDALGVRTVCAGEPYSKQDPRGRHLRRDAEMTRVSDYDVLWVRGEEEAKRLYGGRWRSRVSATELNRLRRVELGGVVGEGAGVGNGDGDGDG